MNITQLVIANTCCSQSCPLPPPACLSCPLSGGRFSPFFLTNYQLSCFGLIHLVTLFLSLQPCQKNKKFWKIFFGFLLDYNLTFVPFHLFALRFLFFLSFTSFSSQLFCLLQGFKILGRTDTKCYISIHRY